MHLSDFDYPLPKGKIALFPAKKRTEAKLLCVDKKTGAIGHRVFHDLPELLKPTDVLVLNNAKVIPARLFGQRGTGGKIEALLLRDLGDNIWESLLKPGGRIKDGETIDFSVGGNLLTGTVMVSRTPGSGKRRIHFQGPEVAKKLHALGHIPLPPYIDRPDQDLDREMYQTVFAEKEGAVASPTAGLHFDTNLLDRISGMGVEIVPITLHVSYGTFQPITADDIDQHKMFEEEYEISEDSAARINQAKQDGRRVVVCGTTCVRALESAAQGTKGAFSVGAGKAATSLFIHPPYEFKIVDALVTNFHMPKSTLLVMIASFLGYERMMEAYNTALKNDYRFASYGDAMFIQ